MRKGTERPKFCAFVHFTALKIHAIICLFVFFFLFASTAIKIHFTFIVSD